MTPTPTDPMPSGNWVIVVLPNRCLSPLDATACLLHFRSRRCHPHVNAAIVCHWHPRRRRPRCRCLRRRRPCRRPRRCLPPSAAAVCRHDRRFRHHRCRFLVDCCMWNPPPPLHRSSRHSMTSSYHRGRQRQTIPTPADPMQGGHRVVVVLIHWRPSPLAATACSLHCRNRRCHPHSPRRWQNDWRRWRRWTTAGQRGDHIVVADRGRRRGRL